MYKYISEEHNRYLSLLTFWHNSLQQISRTSSLQHLNIGGTFITDESLFAIAVSCPHVKVSLEENCLLSQLGFIFSDIYKAKTVFLLFMVRVLRVEISIFPLTHYHYLLLYLSLFRMRLK